MASTTEDTKFRCNDKTTIHRDNLPIAIAVAIEGQKDVKRGKKHKKTQKGRLRKSEHSACFDQEGQNRPSESKRHGATTKKKTIASIDFIPPGIARAIPGSEIHHVDYVGRHDPSRLGSHRDPGGVGHRATTTTTKAIHVTDGDEFDDDDADDK
eukprot:CAMPEP_0197173864 /NCGR_PEP_ID=MMETSP1423-20130617/627_1 /TAXON_ID=476441 /ORGANISM="Pseudo-nitzschia heimii, Strain UNC1101" /LENGTH=153 /DNA_ID=CAMNT_0042622733 /DNA_START=396 /DNA_END=857 /DNA_ORIENTATION=+